MAIDSTVSELLSTICLASLSFCAMMYCKGGYVQVFLEQAVNVFFVISERFRENFDGNGMVLKIVVDVADDGI